VPQVTHQINGRETGKEHFEQHTRDADLETELSIGERIVRLEHQVFPHLKVNPVVDRVAEIPAEAIAQYDQKITRLEGLVEKLLTELATQKTPPSTPSAT
jgi:hypothetical protein